MDMSHTHFCPAERMPQLLQSKPLRGAPFSALLMELNGILFNSLGSTLGKLAAFIMSRIWFLGKGLTRL